MAAEEGVHEEKGQRACQEGSYRVKQRAWKGGPRGARVPPT